eukprot:Skav200255  [mRNA]  locus=scaffold128:139023:142765:+ [translate_table: standard]
MRPLGGQPGWAAPGVTRSHPALPCPCPPQVTMPPCKRCFMLLVAAGVKRIVTRKALLPQEAKDAEIEPAARRHEIAWEVVPDTDVRRERLDALGRAANAAAVGSRREEGPNGEKRRDSVKASVGNGEWVVKGG